GRPAVPARGVSGLQPRRSRETKYARIVVITIVMLSPWPVPCVILDMRNTKLFLLSTAIAVLAAGVPLAGPAAAQPAPPPPPGMRAPFMPGDLHVRIVDTPRPALRHEVRTERPSPNHVWV